mmetsp:Transcript_28606/g.77068  ORF Transcript_28606/g.77068 Transcript_28606/m.77068 type:complete len:278 (+) Transcript_28606:155-988(+)
MIRVGARALKRGAPRRWLAAPQTRTHLASTCTPSALSRVQGLRAPSSAHAHALSTNASSADADLSSARKAQLLAEIQAHPGLAEEVLKGLPEEARKRVGMSWAVTALEDEFAKADANRDGTLTYEEFSRWGRELVRDGPSASSEEATPTQLFHHVLRCSVPCIAFGMVDNGLMVISGEAIDSTLGVLLGISTMAAAALGNAMSNAIGMGAHGGIERIVARLGIPDPHLTLAQMRSPRAMAVKTIGSIFGVTVGCLMGMFPLLFMNKQPREREPEPAT